MPRKGERETIERGISRDGSGYAVRVKVAGVPRERRFPLSVDLPFLKSQRAQLEADLRDELHQRDPDAPPIDRGTFAQDVAAYLTRMTHRLDARTLKSRASELERWAEVFGGRSRHTLRQADIERAIAAWKVPPGPRRVRVDATGRRIVPRPWVAPSAKTIQNRVRTLRHLYRVLDGKRARTPLDDLQLRKPPKTRPRAVDVRTIRTVIANLIRQERRGRLRDAKTRARFLVMVTTGQRPVQLAATTDQDVSLERALWWVPAAKGGEPVELPLNHEMLAAWTLFIRAHAWGAWDSRSFARTLRRAGWPSHIRPYNARHSVGLALSEAGVDLGDIQPFLSHSQLQTTRTFYVPGLTARLKSASQKLDHRVNFSPRWARYVGTPENERKSRTKAHRRRGKSSRS